MTDLAGQSRWSEGLSFEFSTATEIVFGWGRAAELGERALSFGTTATLVTGAHPQRIDPIVRTLQSCGLELEILRIAGEPTVSDAMRGVDLARSMGADLVIAIGGGSVLDAGKAIAALVANPGPATDYLEVVGLGKPLLQASAPMIAVPTTAGTGSEVTRNAVLKVIEKSVKVSLRGLSLLPRLALVDPELTVSVPSNVTASTGLDALTQVIEPYLSKARGPLTDALCLEGMHRAARSLRAAVVDGTSRQAREDLAVTSLFGGLGLANAKLGAVHGFAAPIGGRFDAPHGQICARLLPLVMNVNLEVARQNRDGDVLERFTTIAAVLTRNASASAEDGIAWLARLVEDFRIPQLRVVGMRTDDIPSIVDQARRASSMKGNPFDLSPEVLATVLERAL